MLLWDFSLIRMPYGFRKHHSFIILNIRNDCVYRTEWFVSPEERCKCFSISHCNFETIFIRLPFYIITIHIVYWFYLKRLDKLANKPPKILSSSKYSIVWHNDEDLLAVVLHRPIRWKDLDAIAGKTIRNETNALTSRLHPIYLSK